MKLIFVLLTFSALSAFAEVNKLSLLLNSGSGKQSSVVYLEDLPSANIDDDSILQFRGGNQNFNQLTVTNSYYDFHYPKNLSSNVFAIGWEKAALRFLGRWGARVDLAYSSYGSEVNVSNSANGSQTKLHILPLTAGLVYLADFHPLKRWLMPVAGFGISYYSYFQTGDLDSAQARGGAWTTNFTIGLRHSLSWIGWDKTQVTGDYIMSSKTLNSQVDFSGEALLFGFASTL